MCIPVSTDSAKFVRLLAIVVIDIPLYAVIVRRLHDMGTSGKWFVVVLVLFSFLWSSMVLSGQGIHGTSAYMRMMANAVADVLVGLPLFAVFLAFEESDADNKWGLEPGYSPVRRANYQRVKQYFAGDQSTMGSLIFRLQNADDGISHFLLSKMYQIGTPATPHDDVLSAKHIRKGACANYGVAQYDVAQRYSEGVAGIEKNDSLASKWFVKAGSNGCDKSAYEATISDLFA